MKKNLKNNLVAPLIISSLMIPAVGMAKSIDNLRISKTGEVVFMSSGDGFKNGKIFAAKPLKDKIRDVKNYQCTNGKCRRL